MSRIIIYEYNLYLYLIILRITHWYFHVTNSNQNNTTQKHPGFQDCYDSDDDCLSTTYSAAFVAEDWIKSLPCGKDADCLPEELSHPGTMKDSGVEKVNVMEYLNIQKAEPVSSDKKGK